GQPVAGLHITIVSEGCRIKSHDGGNIWGNGGVRRRCGETDPGGHFTIKNVPRQKVTLRLDDDRILPAEHPLDAHEAPTGIEIQVALRCHVQFQLEQPPPGDVSFALLDREGKRVTMWVFGDGNTWAFDRGEFTGQLSAVVSAPDSAETIVVLDKDGKELK